MYKSLLSDVEITKNLMFPKNCVTFFGSARFSDDNIYSKKAYKLAKMLASDGFTIITGGGGGIMKAANKGAFEAGKDSFAINVILPHEQKINEFATHKSEFSNLALRKVALIEYAQNFVIFPGGYGTMDELFEVLVLVQNGIKDAKVYLYGVEFYTPMLEFLETSLVKEGAISKVDTSIFMLTDDIDEIYKCIKGGR